MSEAENTNARQVAAYSLTLALHGYADWVSSLGSAMPSRRSAAHHDIRLILDLRDQHSRRIARHIDDLMLGHQRLREAMGGGAAYTDGQSSGEIDRTAQAASQTFAVKRLLSVVKTYYLTASPAPTAGADPGEGRWGLRMFIW